MKKLLVLSAALLMLTGCISPKTYVDPSFAKANYDDIQTVKEKYTSNVLVQFQRNGEPLEEVNQEVRNHVERTLRASGVVVPTNGESQYSIEVVVNNVADIAEAAAKGFGTGLTFGAAGSLVTDYYEVTVSYQDDTGSMTTKSYKHALHTTIGNKKAPFENVTPTTPSDGFGTVVEQVLLNFISDMQKDGKFTLIKKYQTKHSV